MKILTANQVRQLDQYTIENEPISSIDLMERASRVFSKWFTEKFPSRKNPIYIFCGPGNNGGDGLAIARILSQDHFDVKAFLIRKSNKLSPDCGLNFERIKKEHCCPILEIDSIDAMPNMPSNAICIDALFGSGLNRSLENFWEKVVDSLNQQSVTRVSVDIPSGMFADQSTEGTSIHADYTFSFELPKLGFLFPENENRVGEWEYGSIELNRGFLERVDTPHHLITSNQLSSIIRPRKKYAHKGSFGHALLVAGGYGKVGAAILAARSILRSGAGLVTVHAPKCAYPILQVAFPEAMVSVDEHEFAITAIHDDWSKYKAIGVGCGIGTNQLTVHALRQILKNAKQPLVLDADALNLISSNGELMSKIPKGTILTPHPKEFERLFGHTSNDFERNRLQIEKAKELGVYLFLKGAHTSIATPDGKCYFNTTGNPGMATGGSGDVLTGILTGLLAQGYSSYEASLLGVYLHGLAGDLAKEALEQEALLASDIIDHIGKAFIKLKNG